MLKPLLPEEPAFTFGAREKSAVAILVAFGLWALGVLVRFPSSPRSLALHQITSQTEARNSLRELAGAQLEFYRRNGHFAYDFSTIGYRPTPPLVYVIAFPHACTDRHSSPTAMTSSLEVLSRGVASSDSRPRTLTMDERERVMDFLASSPEVECPDPHQDFVALAIGDLDGDPALDVWAIDRSFQLRHLQSDD